MNASLNEKLRNVKWGEYKLGDLFDINPTKYYRLSNEEILAENGTVPLVSNGSINNGVMGFSKLPALNAGNSISCSDTTLGAETMYFQRNDYIGYQHIQAFIPKFNPFSRAIADFIIAAVRVATSNSSYDYGHKFNRSYMRETIIMLPTKNAQIDYEFMNSFIEDLELQRIEKLSNYLVACGLDNAILSEYEKKAIRNSNSVHWEKFRIGDLFEKIETNRLSYKAKDLPVEIKGDFDLPCLTSSFMNQGLNYYVPRQGATILKNVISIPQNSDVYRAYYQSSEFTVLSDAYAMDWHYDNRQLTREQYLFLVMCINKVTDLPIYSYKNKLGGWNVVKEKNISLPVSNGEIDFEFMNHLISAIEKEAIKDVVNYVHEKTSGSKVIANE